MPAVTTGAFLILFALCAVLAWVAVFSHGRLWRKVAALLALLALIPTTYVMVNELLGLPKPASTAWLQDLSDYRRVIGYDIREDKAIYLWLAMPDGQESRLFSFPYETETISRLQDAQERSEALASQLLARLVLNDGESRARLEFTNSTEFARELPKKPEVEEDDAIEFNSSSGDGGT
jgi:hypothetical protein